MEKKAVNARIPSLKIPRTFPPPHANAQILSLAYKIPWDLAHEGSRLEEVRKGFLGEWAKPSSCPSQT
jgi:hypothetical protein